jgi:hypothetical protein
MNGKRFRLRPAQLVLVLPAVALLVWGILGGGLRPGTPVAVAPIDPTGSAPAMVAASETHTADSGRWCDEGLGCNDDQ